ncbi:hypothetical protein [Burkholderia catarinensis]|uniref:hypothetical protein n=1 Tax=Burkholderia catarinensis TaxID=1108140 RepID=UPI00100831C6|nr:hypothetical protein [Burkholderia catarinensis]
MIVGTECSRRVWAGMTVVQSIEIHSHTNESPDAPRLPVCVCVGAWVCPSYHKRRCAVKCRIRSRAGPDVMCDAASMRCGPEKTN